MLEEEPGVGLPAQQRLPAEPAPVVDEVTALDEELLARLGQLRVRVEYARVLGDEDVGGSAGSATAELEALDRRGDEPAGRIRLALEPLPIAGEDDLVELGEAVVGEPEVAQVDPTEVGLDPLPGGERDREVGLLVVERLVGGGCRASRP